MRTGRGSYRKSYIVPHGNGFKYLRRVPGDIQKLEKRRTWVKCLGNVSRAEAEILAHGLAYEHGRRILALRASQNSQTTTPPAVVPITEGQRQEVADQVPRPTHNGQRPHRSLMRLVDLWERRKSPRSQIGLARTRLCVRRFIDLVGDLEPHEVTRAHVIAYRDELESLPRMKSDNIAEHLCKVHVLFNLALSEGLVSTNPAHGIRARDFGIKLAAKRQGFTSNHVRDIFKALTGEADAFCWVVRLLAYHGMRSGEASQLRSADVTVLHGVPVLRVHDLHGRVKNRTSIRDIPIHPACMEILRVAKEVEAKHGSGSWLLPSLPVKELGRGRWFQDHGSRFLRHKVGISDRRYTMHSFRHLWRTLARECQMPESVSRAIMGHTLGSGEHGAYGGAPSLKLRAEWMDKIDPLGP
jgi:integrase